RPKGQLKLGTRSELKNMNSFRNVQHALEYEIQRQRAILEGGGHVVQETRLWDVPQGVTHSMRGKEEAHDYRYFPEPDLVPVVISDAWREEIRNALPELPMEKRNRFVSEYGIPSYDAGVLTANRDLADYYEETARLCEKPKIASNWVMGDFLAYLNEEKLDVAESPVTPSMLAELINIKEDRTISGKIAKEVFEDMWKSGKNPKEIVEEKGLVQITDTAELEKIVEEVLEANQKQLEQYRSGREKLFGFFVGQTMKATRGKANPEIVNKLLKKKLSTL
ncbi:MAG: Asp-tRNA(Asn)/Glu-tRNA(Gln) amidotransferase subunit GatB, partial [Thermodesulfobacteriota bacterium]|nr:Asp-tRNA(Asn)/Glu-tRNA(Gln) amidotransferase subunit GatB [Thermodesulfobacteriota bacterium]